MESIERVKEMLMGDGEGRPRLTNSPSSNGDEATDGDNDDDANSGVEYFPAPEGVTGAGPCKKKKLVSVHLYSYCCFW